VTAGSLLAIRQQREEMKMTRSTPWHKDENGSLVSMYFEMLDAAQDGQRYSKADHIRAARGEPQTSVCSFRVAPLSGRSRGSIEFKLMNATAAHADLIGESDDHQHDAEDYLLRTMHDHGYRALPNYQAGLKSAMACIMAERELDRAESA
jgi:hypothetical protein